MPTAGIRFAIVLVAVAAQGAALATQNPPTERRISRATLEDKVRGGWAGQMIGVSFGAPTEFKSNGRIIEGDLPAWTPGRVENAINQDDLYVEMTFAEVMDRVGLQATAEQYGEAFRRSEYALWHANAAARRLLNQGIKAPLSGHPKYNAHANDIDFQIESDFIGLMTPGLPREATTYCQRVGGVMNWGDGLYGGIFVTTMYAAAFFEPDPRRIVEEGLASLPPGSGYARIIRDVLKWSAEQPDDWKVTWQRIQDKWDHDDPCPDGALQPFNIDARLNGAYIALGLLYGQGDFTRTIDISTRAGQDSDCNPSNAAGVLGTMLGYSRIPDDWKSGIPALAGRKFAYTSYSFDDIVASTMKRARKVIEGAGGQFGAEVVVPPQRPEPPPLEQWDLGLPLRRIEPNAPAWTRSAGETVLTFTGSAVMLLGPYSQKGGRAEVFLDGQPAGTIDAYIPPRTNDNALWHASDLPFDAHTVRIVPTGKADARSAGTEVDVRRAVVFRPRQLE